MSEEREVSLETLAEALSPGDPVLARGHDLAGDEPRAIDAGAALDAVLTDLRGDAREREQQLEALLFSTHVPLTTAEIARALVRSTQEVEAGLQRLERALADRSTAVALFVREKGGERAFILDLKAAYRKDAAAVAPPMLKQAVTETLALVAINQPLSQARLVRERGSTVYDHVKELMTRGLIARQRKGRNYFLRTTDAFAAEFGLDNDPDLIRRALARAAGVERTPEVMGSPRVHMGEGEAETEALVAEAMACVPAELPPTPEPVVVEGEAVADEGAASAAGGAADGADTGTDESPLEAPFEAPADEATAASTDDAVPAQADDIEDCVVSGGEPPRAGSVVPAPAPEAPLAGARRRASEPAAGPAPEAPPSRIAHLLDLFQEQSTTDDW